MKSSDCKRKIDELKLKEQEFKNIVPFEKAQLSFHGYNGGDKLRQQYGDYMIYKFNTECDRIINSISFRNNNNLVSVIQGQFERINRSGEILRLSIADKYKDIKVELAYAQRELCVVQEKEREYEEHQKEILKDQIKAEKEMNKQKDKDSKLLTKLQYEYNKLIKQNKPTDEVEYQISKLEKSIKKTEFNLTNKRSGFMYVVSNRDMIDCYKIGITRRESIEQRMLELGDSASHSFPMEVHGYVFMDDIYKRETEIHNYFEDKRVNTNVSKKEWFFVTLDEIKYAFKKLFDIDIILSDNPCEDFKASKEKFVDFY